MTRNDIRFRAAFETAINISVNALGTAFTNAQHYLPEDVCEKAMAASEALTDLYHAVRHLNEDTGEWAEKRAALREDPPRG